MWINTPHLIMCSILHDITECGTFVMYVCGLRLVLLCCITLLAFNIYASVHCGLLPCMVGVLCNVRSLSGIHWVIETPLVTLIISLSLSLSLKKYYVLA